jgi:3-methyladenine DNA glycosylase Mpg
MNAEGRAGRRRPAAVARLDRSFYSRPTLEVARDLLGCRLYRKIGRRVLSGRIVEVEAYTDDAASHSRGQKRTPRNAIMFGPAGHSYVYFTYGMHYCLNAVAKTDGVPGAVLIRGLDEIGASLPCAVDRSGAERARPHPRHHLVDRATLVPADGTAGADDAHRHSPRRRSAVALLPAGQPGRLQDRLGASPRMIRRAGN